jgi:pimeloyl-ACP methyl ester carboxylesterase
VAIAARDERIKVMVTLATPYNIPFPDKRQFTHVRYKAYLQLDSGRRLGSGFFDDVSQYNIRSAISNIQSPLLIIHGSSDELIPIQNAYKLYRNANKPKQLEIVEGANHSFEDPGHINMVVNLSLKWFKSYL